MLVQISTWCVHASIFQLNRIVQLMKQCFVGAARYSYLSRSDGSPCKEDETKNENAEDGEGKGCPFYTTAHIWLSFYVSLSIVLFMTLVSQDTKHKINKKTSPPQVPHSASTTSPPPHHLVPSCALLQYEKHGYLPDRLRYYLQARRISAYQATDTIICLVKRELTGQRNRIMKGSKNMHRNTLQWCLGFERAPVIPISQFSIYLDCITRPCNPSVSR